MPQSICPLRYCGSKFRLGQDIVDLSPRRWRRYYEPFMGSATVFLNFVPENKAAHLNDFHWAPPDLYSWIRDDAGAIDAIMDLRRALMPELEHELAIRVIFEQMKPRFRSHDPLAFLFLNRYAHGQYVREHRKDVASFDATFTASGMTPLTRCKLEACRRKLRGTEITQVDFREFMGLRGEDTWMVLDPPYVIGRHRHHGSPLYQNELSLEDHVQLASCLKKAQFKFLLTIGDSDFEVGTPDQPGLYTTTSFHSDFRNEPGFRVVRRPYRLSGRTKGSHPMGAEYIVMNYDE